MPLLCYLVSRIGCRKQRLETSDLFRAVVAVVLLDLKAVGSYLEEKVSAQKVKIASEVVHSIEP